MSGLIGNVLVYAVIVFICILIACFTKSEFFSVVTLILIISAPISIPVSHMWLEYGEMEKSSGDVRGRYTKRIC